MPPPGGFNSIVIKTLDNNTGISQTLMTPDTGSLYFYSYDPKKY